MKGRRFLWSAHPARAILESWLLGFSILAVLSLQVGAVSAFVLSNGLLFLCGLCGLWCVLRIRLPGGSWWRQGLWETVVGLALGLAMAVGLVVPARLLGWEGVWLQSNLKSTVFAPLLLLAIGPGYVLARGGVRLWLLWDRLRRRRMLWAITHAQLTVVVLVILFVGAALILLSTFLAGEPSMPADASSLPAVITERLLQTIFPTVGVVVVMTALTLLVLMPPSALVSFLVARRTTHRLEALVDATAALREGRYSTRVEVAGEDELARLQGDFNAMAGELERAVGELQLERDRVALLLQSQRELVASVSHELRTPVATVRGHLESGRVRWGAQLPDELRDDLQIAEEEIVRLQGLIDDLFTLSRAEAGGLALDVQPIDAGTVIRRQVQAIASLAWQSSRVEVTADLPVDLPLVLADEARLGQVLANLLRNGVRHTMPGGIVAVVACAEVQLIRIEVRDTGEGIATEDLPHIWERFYTGRSSGSTARRGAGLGLALVKDLVEAMGGTVAVESTAGQGSCFTVRLPRAG